MAGSRACANAAAVDALEEEVEDRFGAIPQAAQNLLLLARLRVLARAATIGRIDAGPAAIAITPVDASNKAPAGLEDKEGRWLFRPTSDQPAERMAELEDVLADLADA